MLTTPCSSAEVNDPSPSIIAPREYRLASQFRRCAWLALGGGGAVLGLLVWLEHQGLGPPNADATKYVVLSLFFILTPVALVISVESYRLRVDDQGLSRRRWWIWSTWPWEAFHDGRAQIAPVSKAITFPSRPWWDRCLLLDFLAEADREQVVQYCGLANEAGVAPEPVRSVDEIVLIHWRYRVRLTREAVEITDRRKKQSFAWSQVKHLRCEWEPLQSYVCLRRVEIQCELPEPQKIEAFAVFNRLNGRRVMMGVDDIDPWEQSVRARMISGELVSLRAVGEPRSEEERLYHIAWLEKMRLFDRRNLWFCLPAIIVLMAIMFANPQAIGRAIAFLKDPFLPVQWKILGVLCFSLSAIMQPLLVFIAGTHNIRSIQKRIAKLQGSNVEYQAETASGSTACRG